MTPDPTVRVVYDPTPVMAGSLCLRETTPHEPCTQPWGHDGDCGDLDAAIRRHPAGNRLTHRCRCGHGPSTHTGGYGQCWQHPCGCDRYEDHTPPRVPEHLRTDDIQDYLRQKGEIQ